MHRLFIAIDFPDETRDAIANICFGVPGAKWVSKDQLHLTIRFIGDADDGLFSEIAQTMHDVNASRFNLTLKGVGYFPPHKKPNVLWVGIEQSEGLMLLRDEVEGLLEELGLEPEARKFSPHLTVARLRPEAPLSKITGFLSANNLFKAEDVPITEFHLYSSVLMPAGAVHTIEESYQLL
ncbi:MAG TPA: RNA 2',3'-cyclic phosphodiesterase [Chitinivibrionales bacterium]|nr:RNA 2',3'-cyclic phosphodiesterase [Chitinivibrionales bacterium]